MLRLKNHVYHVGLILPLIFLNSKGINAEERVTQRQYIDASSYLWQIDLVTQREKLALEPLGINIGGFKVFPKFGFNSEYSTNIFREDSALQTTVPADDYIAHLQPGLWVVSNWSRHGIKLYVDSDVGIYADNTDQNYEDFNLNLDGRLDILTNSSINAGFHYDKEHEDRGSPEQAFGRIPTFFQRFAGDLFFKNKFNRFSADIGIGASYFKYEDTPVNLDLTENRPDLIDPVSGVILGIKDNTVTNQDRNRWIYQPTLRLGYEIKPQYEVFLKLDYIGVDYDEKFDDIGLQRSSDGYEGLLGLSFDLTELISGEIGAGYMYREYDDPQLENFDGVKGYLNLDWSPTRLTTVHSSFTRSIAETTQIGVAGIVANAVNVSIDHELRRNIMLRVAGGYTLNDFNGSSGIDIPDRQEDVYYANAGIKYNFSRYLSADLSYTYQQRDVNIAFNNFDVHQVMLNFQGNL